MEKKNGHEFVRVASDFALTLGNLSTDHPLHFPRTSLPHFHVFYHVMKKIFAKACAVQNSLPTCNANGYAICGGRTSGLRLCSTIAPLLLDNVVNVHVDYRKKGREHSPFLLLRNAMEDSTSERLGSLLGLAQKSKRVVMFSADGICNIYERDEHWADLHTLANNYSCALFVADKKGSLLQAMVEGENNADLLRKTYPKVQPSLNETKLSIIHNCYAAERK